MDRMGSRANLDRAAVRTFGPSEIEFILRRAGRAGEPGESACDEGDRPDLYEVAVLRVAANHGRTSRSGLVRERETNCATHAEDGIASDCARATYESTASEAQGVPVPLEEGISVLGGGDGLVQPVRACLGAVELPGDDLLPGRLGEGTPEGSSRYLQHGSRSSVYKRGVHTEATREGNPDQHGRKRAGLGQHLRRAVMEDREVRGSLSKRLRGRDRGLRGAESVLSILQWPAPTPGLEKKDTRGGLLWPKLKAAAPASLSPQGGGRSFTERTKSDNFHSLTGVKNCPMDGGKLPLNGRRPLR